MALVLVNFIPLTSQATDFTAFMFVRAVIGTGHSARRTPGFGLSFAALNTGHSFLIKRLGNGGGSALVAECFYQDLFLIPALPNMQPIADRYFFGDFDPLSFVLDFAAFDGTFCQAAGFEEARGP